MPHRYVHRALSSVDAYDAARNAKRPARPRFPSDHASFPLVWPRAMPFANYHCARRNDLFNRLRLQVPSVRAGINNVLRTRDRYIARVQPPLPIEFFSLIADPSSK